MEYIYVMEFRTPHMAKGEWQAFAHVESENVAMNWWNDMTDNPRKWYRQQGKLYCKTHYIGGEPVTYRVSRHCFYTEKWLKGEKKLA